MSSEAVKFLGVFIDKKLSWKDHITKITTIISRNIGIMSKLRYKLHSDTLLTLYNCMVLSHLNYCCIVWGCASQSNLNSILKLQKRAVRIILKAPFLAHTNPLFLKLKVLKINDVCKLRIATFMYNAVHPSISHSLHLFYTGFSFTHVTNYNLHHIDFQA